MYVYQYVHVYMNVYVYVYVYVYIWDINNGYKNEQIVPKFTDNIKKQKQNEYIAMIQNQYQLQPPEMQTSHYYNETVVPFNYKYLMISFLVIKYAWEQYINFRQLKRNLIKDMPDQLKKYKISTNQFLLSQSYSFDKITFQMLALSIRMAVDVLAIACNLLPFIWDNVSAIFPFVSMESEFQRAVGYTLIEAFKSKAFEVPISAYQTFVIQKKYNFTNKTFQLFVFDLFVEAALMLIIFPPIIYGYLEVVQLGGEYFYIFLQIFVICITIILTWIHPNLIAPLFNKFVQLKDIGLKTKIFNIAKKNGIKISNVFIINSSVRSSHSNAYLYGIGRTKSIVLYDSLFHVLNKQQQILSVIAHQMGHSHGSHSLKKLLIYLIQVLSMFYIFAQFIKNQNVFISFGFHTRSVFICTALYFHMFQPLTSVFNTLLLVVTRKFQFQADHFACEQSYGEHLKNGFIKLFKQSTSTVRPDIIYAWIKHSHPSIYERIQKIDQFLDREKKKNDDAYRQENKNRIRGSMPRQNRISFGECSSNLMDPVSLMNKSLVFNNQLENQVRKQKMPLQEERNEEFEQSSLSSRSNSLSSSYSQSYESRMSERDSFFDN